MIAGLPYRIHRPAISTRRPHILLVGLVAAAAGACSADSATIAGPSPVKCALTATLAASTMESSGGAGSITIATTPECTWSASAEAPWVSGFSPASGQGNGQVDFRVAANTAAAPRETEIVINNERLRVRQNGALCLIEVSPAAQQLSAGGGLVTVSVTTLSGCTWSATSDAPWITVSSSASGSGSGTVDLQVSANGSEPRSGTVRVADQIVTITQAAASACSYAIAPATQAFPVGGGTGGPITVAAAPGCSWTAASNVPWITIAAGQSGSGNGVVAFTVAANTGSARTGILTIAGETFLVSQAGVGNCAYTIEPTTQTVGSSGGNPPAVSVSTTAACSWSASSNVSWITIVSGITGTGPGSVSYQVIANSGSARTGTMTIAGQTFSVSQGAASCAYSLAPAAAAVGAEGGSRSFTLTTGSACAWTAAASAPWITITSPASGTGATTIAFTVSANSGGGRSGTIAVGDQTFTVTQAGAGTPPCTYILNPTTQSIPAAGGNGSFGVTTTAACTWTATAGASWISITSGASGTGNGTVAFSVAANTGSERSGAITVGGQTFTVMQAAFVACTPTIAPTSESVPAAGASPVTVTVSAAAGCAWTAASGASWISVASGATGSGDGTVTLSIAANNGSSRTGTATIAGQTFTVTQAGGCTASIAPAEQSVAASGGSGTVGVTAGNGCTWSAASNASWITITSGQTGSGNGSVSFTVSANTGPPRTGTLTIAGQTFTVSQAASCSYSIAPTSASIGASGGAGSPVAVTTESGCAWTASSNAPWISITSGQSGSGNGTVSFTAAPNTGPARSGTMTLAGHTFTVNQAAGCSYAINPTSQTIGAAGGLGSPIAVTAPDACDWSATSNAPWITIASGQVGSGNGTVTFTVAPNAGAARTGTLTIEGQTFTVTQEALAVCAYAIAPTSQTIGADGGEGVPILVTTTAACAWTARSNDGWITIISGESGSGSGAVRFNVARHNGRGERVGTLTVANETVTVRQEGR